MQLLDTDDVVSLRSHKACVLTAGEISRLQEHGLLHKDGFDIYCQKVQGGTFIYEKDLHNINQEIERLKMTTIELKETDDYIATQQKLCIRKNRLEEKEKIYKEISKIIAPSLEEIDRLLEEMQSLDSEGQRRIIWQINMLGAYIKRRANFELRRKESPAIFASELSQTFSEFAVSMDAAGIVSNRYLESESVISLNSAILIIDVYIGMIKYNWPNLKSISVIQSRRENRLSFFIEGTGRQEIAIPEENMRVFADYAAKYNIEMIPAEEGLPATISCTIVTEDGRFEE